LVEHAFASSDESGPHITRFAMYRALRGTLADQDAPERRVLSVSRSAKFVRLLGLREAELVEANYPDYDLAALAVEDASVDFVVSDQVLEHVAGGPVASFAETARVLRPGGIVVHTTCLMNEIHQEPVDYWRLTPFALTMLAERFGLEILEAGSWGNRAASQVVQMGYRKRPVPHDPENPLFRIATENDPAHPIVTWLVARKPGELPPAAPRPAGDADAERQQDA
jgi:SAM-dependent methyltransferase